MLRIVEGDRRAFWCPGCEEFHTLNVGMGSPSWRFNGDYDKPTFEPSVLVRSGHYVPVPGQQSERNCWCTYYQEHPHEPVKYKCTVCHSFVRNGMIEFLGDCTHALAGKTVPLTAAPERPGVES